VTVEYQEVEFSADTVRNGQHVSALNAYGQENWMVVDSRSQRDGRRYFLVARSGDGIDDSVPVQAAQSRLRQENMQRLQKQQVAWHASSENRAVADAQIEALRAEERASLREQAIATLPPLAQREVSIRAAMRRLWRDTHKAG
jgi:hypothetical protein